MTSHPGPSSLDPNHPRMSSATSEISPQRSSTARWLVLAGVVLLATTAWWLIGDRLSLANLAEHEQTLRAYRDQHPALVAMLGFLLYVLVTGLSLPGATGMTLLYGWFFGLAWGLVLVSFASTTGAALAFLTSRYVLRDVVQRKFGKRLATINQAFEREGAFYLFSLRLIPLAPFFVVNLVMGLTPIRMRTYWWVSQLGMLPATCVYVYAGSIIPSLQTLAEQGIKAVLSPAQLAQVFIAFTLIGLLPLAARAIVKRVAPTSP